VGGRAFLQRSRAEYSKQLVYFSTSSKFSLINIPANQKVV
ncbi:hypothetical protein HMPREF3156_01554, partial [Neisseria sp. HMSC06F02]